MLFHYGQRVKCIETPDGNISVVGLTGTVFNPRPNDEHWDGVVFDRQIPEGHYIYDQNRKIHVGDRYGWNCPPGTLIPIDTYVLNLDEII